MFLDSGLGRPQRDTYGSVIDECDLGRGMHGLALFFLLFFLKLFLLHHMVVCLVLLLTLSHLRMVDGNHIHRDVEAPIQTLMLFVIQVYQGSSGRHRSLEELAILTMATQDWRSLPGIGTRTYGGWGERPGILD